MQTTNKKTKKEDVHQASGVPFDWVSEPCELTVSIGFDLILAKCPPLFAKGCKVGFCKRRGKWVAFCDRFTAEADNRMVAVARWLEEAVR